MAKKRIPVFRKNQRLVSQVDLESERRAQDWWRSDGVYIDPDTDEVDWFDKRMELALTAYIAGFKSAMEWKGNDRA